MNAPRILIIDREEHIESMVRGGLLNYPVEMAFSSSCRDGVAQVISEKPDLIVAGLKLIDGTAVDLINQVHQKQGTNPPGLFLVEDQYLEIQKQVLKLGAVDLLARPFEMSALHRKIDHAVSVMKNYRPKTRIERFISAGNPAESTNATISGLTGLGQPGSAEDPFVALLNESRQLGIPLAELIKMKQAPS